ncbi:MAG: hypothetical protein KC933_36405, partial [Myxococcales bacterium]|nr:hypothetical protein [Myxococcales bacterium]
MGANSLRIDTEGGVNVLPETSNPQALGSVVTPSLDVTTTFVLKASNAGGESTGTVTVTVEDPNGPQITDFSASPGTITDGMSSTLSWQTTNAVSGRIELEGTAIYTIEAGAVAAGTYDVTPAQTRTYKLVVASSSGTEVSRDVTVTVNPATGPVIRSFAANPATIQEGQSSTLSWEVSNAQSVNITDDAGQVVYDGADLTGSQSVTPARNTTYTLLAQDGAGATATRTVTITVTIVPPVGATVDSFTAQPAAVVEGGSSTLSWQVTNATGGVEITADGATVHTDTQASGSVSVTPAQTTAYTLTAKNPNGDATATVTVTVTVPGAPAIQTFSAAPSPAALNATTTLTWATAGAAQVRILSGGVELNSSALAAGSFVASLPAEVNVFDLEASAAGQPTATQSVTVYAHPAPAIRAFTVNPTVVSGPTTVTVTWDVTDVSGLALSFNGAAVPGFPQVSSSSTAVDSAGTFNLSISTAGTFELVATSAGGTANQTVQVGTVTGVQEVEPNDTIAQA